MKAIFVLFFLSISTVFAQVDCANVAKDFSGKCDSYDTYSGVRSTYSYKKGQLHGKFEEIYKDGQQRVVGAYKKGLLNGKFSSFYASGEAMTTAKFKSGSGDFVMKHRNGSQKVVGQFENGKSSGNWKFYNENGDLTREMDLNGNRLDMFAFLVGDQQVRSNEMAFGNFFDSFDGPGFSFSFGGEGDSTFAQMRREMNESMQRMQLQMEQMFQNFNDSSFMQSFHFDTTITFGGSDDMNGFFEFKSFGDTSFSKSFHFDTIFGDLPQRSNPFFGRGNDLVDFPDTEPSFIGGEEAMKAYIAAELSERTKDSPSESGTVFIEAIIEKDGAVSNARVALGADESMDQEALRIVKNMPNWKPATMNGEEVRSRCIVPVRFD